MSHRYRGLVAAPHTPFTDSGELDLEPVAAQARHLAKSGVVAVFVAGSTGEGPLLTGAERRSLLERWLEHGRAAGMRVIAHVGSDSPREAVDLARHAAECQVDALAAMAPRYYKPATVQELVAWCTAIGVAAGGVPFYYYDIPALTGVHFPVDEFLEVGSSRIPGLAGIKYTAGDLAAMQRALAFEDGAYELLFGNDEALLAGLVFGCEGAVGSTYNFAAPLYHRLIAAFRAGDLATARLEQRRSVDLVRVLAAHRYLPAAKALMGLLGVPVGPPRAPQPGLSAGEIESVRAALGAAGYFDWGTA